MSRLVDKFVDTSVLTRPTAEEGWFIAKPVIEYPLWERICDAVLVLFGKAVAVHFKQDEIKTNKKKG